MADDACDDNSDGEALLGNRKYLILYLKYALPEVKNISDTSAALLQDAIDHLEQAESALVPSGGPFN